MTPSWMVWSGRAPLVLHVCFVLVSVVIQGSLVLVLAATVVRVWPRASAAQRHVVWAVACSSLLLLLVLSPGMPICRVPALTTAITSVGLVLVLGGWGIGTLVVLAVLVNSQRRARRIVSETLPLQDSWMLDVVACAQRTLHVSSPIQVTIHPSVMPMVCGILQPTIVLPESARTWDENRLYNIVLHELAHIKRYDGLTQAAALLACALYWFNPGVWLAAWTLQAEQEQACDDVVLTAGSRPRAYAADLLELVQTCQSVDVVQLAVLPFAQSSQIEARVQAIVDRSRRRNVVSRWNVMAVCGAGLGLIYPVVGGTSRLRDQILPPQSQKSGCLVRPFTSHQRRTGVPSGTSGQKQPTSVAPTKRPIPDTAVMWVTLSSEHGALRGTLPKLLSAEIAKAKALGRTPFLEVGAPWCPTCVALETSLHDPDQVDAFAGTYIIHLQYNDWDPASDMAPLGYTGDVIPAILSLDSAGRVTSELAGEIKAQPIKHYLRAHLWNPTIQKDHHGPTPVTASIPVFQREPE